MSLQNHSTITEKIVALTKKAGIPLGLLLCLSQSSIVLSNPVLRNPIPSNINGFEALVDLLTNNQNEPEVIIQGDEQGQTTDTDTNGDVVVGQETEPRFTCAVHEGKYTVMYHPESQPGKAYPWAIPSQMGDGWTPQRRCEVISSRLESYRPDGLVELTTGTSNGYDILCVTTEANPACRIVLTVPVGQDPEIVRDDVFESLTVADSGQTTGGVYTFAERDNPFSGTLGNILNGDLSILNPTLGGNTAPRLTGGIYLKPFLDPRDGGTGAYLNGTNVIVNPSGGGRVLNPNIFR